MKRYFKIHARRSDKALQIPDITLIISLKIRHNSSKMHLNYHVFIDHKNSLKIHVYTFMKIKICFGFFLNFCKKLWLLLKNSVAYGRLKYNGLQIFIQRNYFEMLNSNSFSTTIFALMDLIVPQIFSRKQKPSKIRKKSLVPPKVFLIFCCIKFKTQVQTHSSTY